jgi:uncharacterized protein (TIGR00251 family)
MRLAIRVQPRASRDEVAGRHGERWRIRLTAPPVDGRANEALRRFLAERLGVRVAAITVVAGEASRDKVVEVEGLDPAEADRRMAGG